MKKLVMACWLGLLITGATGCISTYVVKSRARPHLKFDPVEQKAKPVDGESGYYALLPLTIIADLATSPFQLLYFGDSHSSHMWIDGWPVPLP